MDKPSEQSQLRAVLDQYCLTVRDFAKLIRVQDIRTVRRWIAEPDRITGPVSIIIELLESDELPERFFDPIKFDPLE